MAKYVQPTFIVDSSATFLGNVAFDSSVFLEGSAFITSPVTSGSATPYALVVDSIGAKIQIKSLLLGTMATATAASYDASIVALRLKDTSIDASLNAIWVKFGNDDTSLNDIWTQFGRVNASIGNVDTSINNIWTKLGNDDTSLNGIWTKLGYVDTSLNNIWSKFGNVDTSLTNLGTKNANQDTSINDIWTQFGRVNASIGNVDTSINDIWIEIGTLASSVPQVKNGLSILADGSIGLGGTLSQNTSIGLAGHTFSLQTGNSSQGIFIAANGDIIIANQGSDGPLISLIGNTVTIDAPGGKDSLVIAAAGTTFTSNSNGGIKYTEDYKAHYTSLSLITLGDLNSSIGAVDSSISDIWTKLGYDDTSLNGIWTKFGYVDTSLTNLGTKNANQDTSINDIWTQFGRVNTSIGNIDTSINDIWTKFGYVDTSLTNLGTKNANQDVSLNAIWTKLGYDDTSLNGIWTQFGYVNSSLNGLDSSIRTLNNAISNTNSSLGLYVLKAGDSMSGPLSITAGGLAVTNNASINGGLSVLGDTYIGGTLTIDGSLYVRSVETIDVSSAYIRLNSGMTGAPPSYMQSGIVIDRGSSDPYIFVYDESFQTFRIGIAKNGSSFIDASTQAVATREDSPTSFGIPFWDSTLTRFDTSIGLTFTPGVGLGLPIATADGAATNALFLNGSNLVVSRTLGSMAFATTTDYTLKTLFDSSLGAVWTKFGYVDTSLLNLGTKNTNQDSSISTLDLLTQVHTAGILDLSTNRLKAVANVPNGGTASIFSYKNDNTAYLKKLVQGTGINITEDTSTITIASSGAVGYVSKYKGTFDGTAASPFVITAVTHALGTGPLSVTTWENNSIVYTGVDVNGSNDVTLSWASGSLTDASCKFILMG